MQRHYIDIIDQDSLTLETDEAPTPAVGELLIAVDFAGVNRADVLQRMGLYPVPEDASPIMGLEVAGTVVSIGASVEGWAIGDKVCALVHGGGYASHAIARADHCLRVPTNLDTETAAALPEALLTVWHNVFTLGRLKAGETLLVHGGGSGIGSIAVQLAKARGANVIATAGGAEKCAAVKALGADDVIDYRTGNLLDALTDRGLIGHIDVILDIAGGDFTNINLAAAAPDGRILCIGVMRGSKAEIELFHILMKRLVLTGSTLRGMGVSRRAAGFNDIQREVMPLVETGVIKPIIHSCVPLAAAMSAHELMQSGEHMGKILLDCSAS